MVYPDSRLPEGGTLFVASKRVANLLAHTSRLSAIALGDGQSAPGSTHLSLAGPLQSVGGLTGAGISMSDTAMTRQGRCPTVSLAAHREVMIDPPVKNDDPTNNINRERIVMELQNVVVGIGALALLSQKYDFYRLKYHTCKNCNNYSY